MMQIPILARRIARSIGMNSPTILSGMAVAGVVGTVVLAVKATPKATVSVSEAEISKNVWTEAQADAHTKGIPVDDYVPLTSKEIVQATWKLYLPAAISGTATIACIIGANQIGLRRNAALLGAYLSLIHISEPTRLGMISYAVFCLKKKKKTKHDIT